MKKQDKFDYFMPEKMPELVERVKYFFSSPEPGVVISAPLSGTAQRVDQIVQDYSHEFNLPVVWINIKECCEDISKLDSLLRPKGFNLKDGGFNILFNNCDYCIQTQNTTILDELIKLHLRSRNVKVVFFFQIDITSDENMKIYNRSKLYSQMYYYPIIDKLDAKRYVDYLTQHWAMPKLPSNITRKIVSICGPQMWLLSNAVREYRSNPRVNFDKYGELPSTKFRLEQLCRCFSKDEIDALTSSSDTFTKARDHLNKLGLIKRNRCNFPILREFLLSKKSETKLILKNDDIFASGINLKHSFTDQENITLKLLLSKNGGVVSREEIADSIWGRQADEKYSIWAIEQLIKRLRTKLIEINLTATAIKTVRNEGYKI